MGSSSARNCGGRVPATVARLDFGIQVDGRPGSAHSCIRIGRSLSLWVLVSLSSAGPQCPFCLQILFLKWILNTGINNYCVHTSPFSEGLAVITPFSPVTAYDLPAWVGPGAGGDKRVSVPLLLCAFTSVLPVVLLTRDMALRGGTVIKLYWKQGGHTQHKPHGWAFPQPHPGTSLNQPGPSHGCCPAPDSASPLDLAWLKIYLLVLITKTHFVLDFKIYFRALVSLLSG